VAAVQRDDPVDAREFVLQRLDHRVELFAHEQDLRIGILQDVFHLRRGQPGVDGDHYVAGFRAAEDDLEVVRRVLREIAHPGLNGQPRGGEPVRHPVHPFVEFGVGGGLAVEDQGLALWFLPCVHTADVGQIQGRHAPLPVRKLLQKTLN